LRQHRYEFDPDTFLSSIGEGRVTMHVSAKQPIFAQGDTTSAIFYIQRGNVKLTVNSETGKEATIGILGAGDFFGEGCLAGQPLRMGSATAVTSCDLLRIDTKAMMDALHREHKLSDIFVSYLLARNIRYQEDLEDQLFNSSEKRLARVLLLLAHFDKEGAPEHIIPEVSQTTLAEMVGTTRSRINVFMNKFKQRGFIRYDRGLRVYSSLLKVILDE
jgi:CRP-like cAMP-binding protein